MSLDGSKIVLTGGAGGIGSLVAQELIDAGAKVVMVDRAKPLLPLPFIKGDLSTMDGIAGIAREIDAEWPDILINMAGVQYFGPFEQQSAAHIHTNYMVNLLAPVLLTRAVLPGMKQRGGGQIVNIGSILGSINYPYFVTYSSAKAGLRGFSEGLRRELRDTEIDVTYIAPRAVRTGLNSDAVMQFARLTKMTMDEPEAVARLIVRAITERKKDVFIGLAESFFVRLNALAPRLVDGGIGAAVAKTHTLFSS